MASDWPKFMDENPALYGPQSEAQEALAVAASHAIQAYQHAVPGEVGDDLHEAMTELWLALEKLGIPEGPLW